MVRVLQSVITCFLFASLLVVPKTPEICAQHVLADTLAWPQPVTSCGVFQMNEILNIFFTAYFTLEMVIKVVGLGLRGYLEDRMNAFDGVVVIASLVEFFLFLRGGSTGSLSVFRAFRLMRVFKLARRWEELNKIVRTIFKSLSSIAYLTLLLLVFIFIMALLGMQMFGHKCASSLPRSVPDSVIHIAWAHE